MTSEGGKLPVSKCPLRADPGFRLWQQSSFKPEVAARSSAGAFDDGELSSCNAAGAAVEELREAGEGFTFAGRLTVRLAASNFTLPMRNFPGAFSCTFKASRNCFSTCAGLTAGRSSVTAAGTNFPAPVVLPFPSGMRSGAAATGACAGTRVK